MTNIEIENTLEALIDANGFTKVLGALFEVCNGKADHLRENWQDADAARAWEHAAELIDMVMFKSEV